VGSPANLSIQPIGLARVCTCPFMAALRADRRADQGELAIDYRESAPLCWEGQGVPVRAVLPRSRLAGSVRGAPGAWPGPSRS
jgi:hypothetical protein